MLGSHSEIVVAAVSRQEAKANYYLSEGHVNLSAIAWCTAQTALQFPNPEKERKAKLTSTRGISTNIQKTEMWTFFLYSNVNLSISNFSSLLSSLSTLILGLLQYVNGLSITYTCAICTKMILTLQLLT